jgi:tetratricopeptide (TPR) repeat protein
MAMKKMTKDEKEPVLSPLTLRIRTAINSFNKGRKLYDNKQYNEALVCFKDALKNNSRFNRGLSDYKIYFQLFRTQRKLGNYRQSYIHLLRFLRMNPHKSLRSFESGLRSLNSYLAGLEKPKLERSMHFFSKSIKENPKDPDSWYYYGYTMLLKGDEKEAKKNFKMVLVLKRDFKNIHEIELFEDIRNSFSQ